MSLVGGVLEGLHSDLPEYASPIVQALLGHIKRGADKCQQYEQKGFFNSVWSARSEAV